MNQYVKQYQKASIETASREQILIMLYDGAIQFLNKAKIDLKIILELLKMIKGICDIYFYILYIYLKF